jgi:hypothetical protein
MEWRQNFLEDVRMKPTEADLERLTARMRSCEARITQQYELLDQLKASGRKTSNSERLLTRMLVELGLLELRRDEIARELTDRRIN